MNKEEKIYPSMVIRSQAEAIKLLETENKQLKEKINTYENPEDLTLMFMYCDEKAKDKIKQLKEVIEEVREYINTRYYRINNPWLDEMLQILDKGESNE